MSASLSALQPELQPYARELVRAAGSAGLHPQVTSTLRSHTQQGRLYSRYLAGQAQYPVAHPGTSAHEFGWAFDMVVSPLSALSDVGDYWEQLGGVWGGRPRRQGSSYDPVHFEYPGWRELVTDQQVSPQSTPYTRPSRSAPGLVSAIGEVAGFADPSGGFGERVVEQLGEAPSRLIRVLTGQTSFLQEYEDYFQSLFGR